MFDADQEMIVIQHQAIRQGVGDRIDIMLIASQKEAIVPFLEE